jgi:hypothetical protein
LHNCASHPCASLAAYRPYCHWVELSLQPQLRQLVNAEMSFNKQVLEACKYCRVVQASTVVDGGCGLRSKHSPGYPIYPAVWRSWLSSCWVTPGMSGCEDVAGVGSGLRCGTPPSWLDVLIFSLPRSRELTTAVLPSRVRILRHSKEPSLDNSPRPRSKSGFNGPACSHNHDLPHCFVLGEKRTT